MPTVFRLLLLAAVVAVASPALAQKVASVGAPAVAPSAAAPSIVTPAAPASMGVIFNDDIYHALPFRIESTYGGTNVGANFEGPLDINPPASCLVGGPSNDGRNSVWYWFRASVSGTVTIDLSGSDFDTILIVLDPSGAEVGCDDDGGTGDRSLITDLAVLDGEYYFIRVTGYRGASGTVSVALTASSGVVVLPPNDTREFLLPFWGDNAVPYLDTNLGATGPDTGEPSASCAFGGSGNDGNNSVWRMFTASASGTVTIDLSGSTFNTLLSITDGLGQTELACDDDSNDDLTSRIADFPVTAGETYGVRVSGYQGSGGQIHYTVSGPITQVATTAGEPGAPATPALAVEAHPNPTASAATVAYTLTTPGEARVEVLDALGRRVAVLHDGARGAGRHEARWDTRGVPAGVYAARVTAGEKVESVRLTVAR